MSDISQTIIKTELILDNLYQNIKEQIKDMPYNIFLDTKIVGSRVYATLTIHVPEVEIDNGTKTHKAFDYLFHYNFKITLYNENNTISAYLTTSLTRMTFTIEELNSQFIHPHASINAAEGIGTTDIPGHNCHRHLCLGTDTPISGFVASIRFLSTLDELDKWATDNSNMFLIHALYFLKTENSEDCYSSINSLSESRMYINVEDGYSTYISAGSLTESILGNKKLLTHIITFGNFVSGESFKIRRDLHITKTELEEIAKDYPIEFLEGALVRIDSDGRYYKSSNENTTINNHLYAQSFKVGEKEFQLKILESEQEEEVVFYFLPALISNLENRINHILKINKIRESYESIYSESNNGEDTITNILPF